MLTYYETEHLILRVLTGSYANEVLDFYLKNKELFEKYEPTRPDNFYTIAYQKTLLTYEYNAIVKFASLRLWIYEKNGSETIIGTVSFTNILPAIYSCCNIGYKFDQKYHGKGLAFEALNKAIEIVFTEHKLHRINAYIMPDNIPSKTLARKLGFEYEGIARKSILIKDVWEDHEIYSLLNE